MHPAAAADLPRDLPRAGGRLPLDYVIDFAGIRGLVAGRRVRADKGGPLVDAGRATRATGPCRQAADCSSSSPSGERGGAGQGSHAARPRLPVVEGHCAEPQRQQATARGGSLLDCGGGSVLERRLQAGASETSANTAQLSPCRFAKASEYTRPASKSPSWTGGTFVEVPWVHPSPMLAQVL